MEQTKSVLPDLLKVYLTGMYFGHGLPPAQQEKRHTRLPSLSEEVLESTGKHRNLTLQIFATDLDTDAIEKRRGFFTSNIVVDVSPERISKFFNIEAGGYRVNSSIRELIFAP
jgi:two-component system CheB/CheR fusion protein